MNVLFVSQCSGRALTETRRILDQFAERRGDRSWHTPITWEGLKTVHKLLRRTARRNTAVACFWVHRDRAELMWIVGDARRFNEQGATPTATTARDLLRFYDENDWRHGEVIRLLAALAALFHDFGKANAAFQAKLSGNSKTRDAYRHEWVSLRLFTAWVGEAEEDRCWLHNLAAEDFDPGDWRDRLIRDGLDDATPVPLKSLPPLARTVGWLIVSHHRLPQGEINRTSGLKTVEMRITAEWCGADMDAGEDDRARCWEFPQGLPLDSRHWRRHTARIARALLKHPAAFEKNWLDVPFVAHLARLTLMLADHHYSSQPSCARYGEPDFPLYANTDAEGRLKQRLDEHLIGVEVNAVRLARTLPRLSHALPHIARHRGFRRRTREAPFLWQNRAFDLAESLRPRAVRQGFFGVNMASTGTGKTLANGRILYALADPRLGARFTVALGLRILTLQTGDAYRQRLGLGDEDLAVLVGGGAVRELYEQGRRQKRETPEPTSVPGSESAADLLGMEEYVHFEGSLEDGPLTRWLERQPRALLQAPIVVCTVDHLAPATEGVRGGRQILPMLRLLTSDLVLDEVDDFDVADLPAVTRLVHWAGMLGSRVLLSSATLPPALVQGLFQAFLEGRRAFQDSRGEPGLPLNPCCAWFDEFGAEAADCLDLAAFRTQHDTFVARRLEKLAPQPQRRRVDVRPLAITADGEGVEKRRRLCEALARELQAATLALHEDNHQTDPATGKRVSLGLIRMANIDPLVETARALTALDMPEDKCLHLCVYHSQFPLYLRAHIEQRLDRLLHRHDPGALFQDEEMRAWLRRHPEPDQIFLVLATPVAEVGRDHDYDWAVVEPSSMRSIIQLAGRVRRHRREAWEKVNIHLLSTNLKALQGRHPAYCRPGYESRDFPLDTYDLNRLLRPDEVARLDAAPRIRQPDPLQPRQYLADLEHAVLADLMLGTEKKRRDVTLWWRTRAHLSGVLQRQQPFRAGRPTEPFCLLPDEDGRLRLCRVERDGGLTPNDGLRHPLTLGFGARTGGWGEMDDRAALEVLAETLEMELEDCARRFALMELPEPGNGGWWYHPALGFSRRRV